VTTASLIAPTIDDIRAAQKRIHGAVERTPTRHSDTLSRITGADVHLKFENLQYTASFKERGALNKLLTLSEAEQKSGVAAMSAGNHAQGVAYHAGRLGIPATIVMPEGTPFTKVKHTKDFGARVVVEGATLTEATARALQIARDEGLTFVHPYDDPAVIAGQGVAALELLDEVPDLDLVVAPVGGGGLLSGTAVAVKGVRPAARVVGAEPAAADDAARSFHEGGLVPMTDPATLADGLRAQLSERTFAHIRRYADDIVTVSEDEIVLAMRALWEALKVVVEPSAAVAYAAIRAGKTQSRGLKVGVILTGGNVDLDRLPWAANLP